MRRPRQVVLGFAVLGAVFVVGTVGYVVLGFGLLDALYQTVTTVTTVGFREIEPLGGAGQVFTIILILVGVGAALYTLTVLFEAFVEGHIGEAMERRRMDKQIDRLTDHAIVCGWGRVGRAVARDLDDAGRAVVVVDSDPERVVSVPAPFLHICGDAADDEVLRRAGIERASALVAAVATDAVNLFISLSGRSLRPDLFIVARAREESSVDKLLRAGADRVVNPQEIGGARIAAFVARPRVTEFLDVVMHSRGIELNLEQITIPERSKLIGQSLHAARVRDRTGALVLAVHDPELGLISNPAADLTLRANQELIAIGTPTQLQDLTDLADVDATDRAARR